MVFALRFWLLSTLEEWSGDCVCHRHGGVADRFVAGCGVTGYVSRASGLIMHSILKQSVGNGLVLVLLIRVDVCKLYTSVNQCHVLT